MTRYEPEVSRGGRSKQWKVHIQRKWCNPTQHLGGGQRVNVATIQGFSGAGIMTGSQTQVMKGLQCRARDGQYYPEGVDKSWRALYAKGLLNQILTLKR